MGKIEDGMTDMERWERDGREWGWTMPAAPRWKRLPIIRHIRTIWTRIQIERWYAHGPGSIGLRTGYDEWAVFGMWHGREMDPDAMLTARQSSNGEGR